jgi:hypothetical protein
LAFLDREIQARWRQRSLLAAAIPYRRRATPPEGPLPDPRKPLQEGVPTGARHPGTQGVNAVETYRSQKTLG